MTSDAWSSLQTRLSQFADFSDVYTSFLFNLLSESLKVKTLAQNMQTAQTDKDWVNFYKYLATLIRTIFSFESSNAMSLNEISVKDLLTILDIATSKEGSRE
jgi:hypothetical protein